MPWPRLEKTIYGFQKPYLLTHLVNLRRRMASSLSEYSIGNLLWIAAAKCMDKDHDQVGLQGLVGEIRGAISRIDGDFVQKLQGHEEIRNSVMCESLKEIGEVGSKDEVDCFGFSSWCNLGFYEADFGCMGKAYMDQQHWFKRSSFSESDNFG
jgi:shikimate O-hydroxycinnamoyltransferase